MLNEIRNYHISPNIGEVFFQILFIRKEGSSLRIYVKKIMRCLLTANSNNFWGSTYNYIFRYENLNLFLHNIIFFFITFLLTTLRNKLHIQFYQQ
jgi:hypothetical protein